MKWEIRGTIDGKQIRATVTADSEDSARARAEASGVKMLTVLPLEEAAPPTSSPAPYEPPPQESAAPDYGLGAGYAQAETPAGNDYATPAATSSKRRSWQGAVANPRLPLILSGIALLLSISAIVWLLFHGPGIPGKSLGSYDFSTPEKAAKSMAEMDANHDIRAELELAIEQHKSKKEGALKRLESFEFNKNVEFGDFVAVLFKIIKPKPDSGDETDIATSYEVEWFHKGKDGHYLPAETFTTKFKDATKDAEKQKTIAEWKAKNKVDVHAGD